MPALPPAASMCCLLLVLAQIAVAGEVAVVGRTPEQVPALAAAAQAAGLTLRAAAQISALPALQIWELTGDPAVDGVAALGASLRAGGGALVTVGAQRNGANALLLGQHLPVVPWWNAALDRAATRGTNSWPGPARIGACAAPLSPAVRTAQVGGYARIFPFAAVERAEARLEHWASAIPRLGLEVPAGHTFWTRPLDNRHWRIVARLDDQEQSPLLILGETGAGRAAVLACPLTALAADDAAAVALLRETLGWLAAASPPAAAAKPLAPEITVEAVRRTLLVQAPGAAGPLTAIVRLLTWEGAPVTDVEAALPVGGSAALAIPMAATVGYRALLAEDRWQARVGLLDAGGRLLGERRLNLDLRPALRLELRGDDPLAQRDAFTSWGHNYGDGFHPGRRLGLPMSRYDYRPGEQATVTVSVSNGLRNLAPEAQVDNLTTPEDPRLVALTDSGASSGLPPRVQQITGYGWWQAPAAGEVRLRLRLPADSTVAGVTLRSAACNVPNYVTIEANPASVIVLVDGQEAARADDAAQRFTTAGGVVRLAFAARRANEVVVLLPAANRGPYRLGELELDGWTGAAPPAGRGTLELRLADPGSADVVVHSAALEIPAHTRQEVVCTVGLPNDPTAAHLVRLVASLTGAPAADLPLLVVAAGSDLQRREDFTGQLNEGTIATVGFRQFFPWGAGTREGQGGWATTDDLLWAWSRDLLSAGGGRVPEARCLFTDTLEPNHLAAPWRGFRNGRGVQATGVAAWLAWLQGKPQWQDAKQVNYMLSDSWGPCPFMDAQYTWTDFEQFHQYLLANQQPGLLGRTRAELEAEINGPRHGAWMCYHRDRFTASAEALVAAVAGQGKRLILGAQGWPITGSAATRRLSAIMQGMSDDWTWGGELEDDTFTLSRQLLTLALSPGWRTATVFHWGWDNATLKNMQWNTPPATTESARRSVYARAFRGLLGADGVYGGMDAIGFAQNGNLPYDLAADDWQQGWNAMQRWGRLRPEAPVGAGFVLGGAFLDDPANPVFTSTYQFFAGGLPFPDIAEAREVYSALAHSGVSLPFAANARALARWPKGVPVVVGNAGRLDAGELQALTALAKAGTPILVFVCGVPVSPAQRTALLGGSPERAGDLAGAALWRNGSVLLADAPAKAITAGTVMLQAKLLLTHLAQRLVFPAGTTGYGFQADGRLFAVLLDGREEARQATLRWQSPRPELRPLDADTHRPLTCVREAEGWWSITVPLAPGDGKLIVLEDAP